VGNFQVQREGRNDEREKRCPRMSDRTRPSAETRAAEQQEARRGPSADREPTPDEEELAERNDLPESVVEHEREMAERGVHQKGEGRIP
jgi:hypothetical protein